MQAKRYFSEETARRQTNSINLTKLGELLRIQ